MKKLFIITALLMYSGCSLRFPGSDMDSDTISDGNTYSDNACPELTDPANGSATSQGTELNDTAIFSCDTNFSLTGNAAVTCTSDGWNPSPPKCKLNWAYRRQIDVTGGEDGLQLLVVLPSDFDFSNARAEGRDIRFSTESDGSEFNLDYYIESWTDGKIWVLLTGTTDKIYMFYGNSSADSAGISFETMFPNHYHLLETNDVTLSGTQTFDYVRLAPGAWLRVAQGEILTLNAQKIVLEGDSEEWSVIYGLGKGYAEDSAGNEGRGTDSESWASGGGGAYGNDGGDGGTYNNSYPVGEGGESYGAPLSYSIQMGSSGGNGEGGGIVDGYGGDGGGAVWLNAQEVVVAGRIVMSGALGRSGDLLNAGGGGSGGGILIEGNYVTFTDDAYLSVEGGDGGESDDYGVHGGGGGGGRIKVFSDDGLDISTEGIYSALGGSGGKEDGDDDSIYFGGDGLDGTVNMNLTADYPVRASVKDEERL